MLPSEKAAPSQENNKQQLAAISRKPKLSGKLIHTACLSATIILKYLTTIDLKSGKN